MKIFSKTTRNNDNLFLSTVSYEIFNTKENQQTIFPNSEIIDKDDQLWVEIMTQVSISIKLYYVLFIENFIFVEIF